MYIRDKKSLAALVRDLRGIPYLAIDTEFVREKQYYPQLEIIQVATEGQEAIIDYRAIGTLEPFTELLNSPHTLKILHAANQDLEIFFNLTGTVPAPLFDTQVAAAMVGLGAQVGYSRLVDNLLGVSLAKSETLTDWSRRPLSSAQIEYALNDVRFLIPLHQQLVERLKEMGRQEWLDEEWRVMSDPDTYRRVHPREAYRRVQGMNRLKARDLAILRELAEWREREGIRRDRAPGLLVRDHILVELARRAPDNPAALKEIRGLHPKEVERQGRAIVEAIKRGKSLPREEWPRLPERNELSEQESSLVSLMQAWLRACADEANIAPNYLATSAELKELVTTSTEEREQLGVLRGWRRRLVGGDLLAIAEGRASLAWEPEKQRMRLVYSDNVAS